MINNKLNLLIIEDSEYDAELLVHQLRKNGFDLEYKLIETANEVKKSLSKCTYDLIISDYNLSGFTGIEALKLVKEKDPMLPFILISGFINPEQETKILQLGANEVILKSNLNRLPYSVRRILYEVADKKKLKKLLDTKDMMMSILSHDLKGTIEGIMVLAEFLQDDVGDAPENQSLRESLELIARSARSTSQLLDNLLNWTLMQIGAFEPSFKEIDLIKCLRTNVDLYQSKAVGKEVAIEFSDLSRLMMQGDWNMLSIVFRNLISNAIKFSNPGGSVRIETSENTEQVHISVTDYGIGIPAEIKTKLFNPENRPRRPGTNQEQSTGLGLLLCNDVVRIHGGSITVDSEENEGSTFTVHLPKRIKKNEPAGK